MEPRHRECFGQTVGASSRLSSEWRLRLRPVFISDSFPVDDDDDG